MKIELNKKWIIISVLIGSVLYSIYLLFQIAHLERQVRELSKQSIIQPADEDINKTLQTIDSLLLNGDYLKALDIYYAQLEEDRQSMEVLKLEGELANEVAERTRSNEGTDNTVVADRPLRDSNVAKPEEIRLFDSLQFALTKAKAQVKNMRRQLENKSFGEYLTFESSKGSVMNYVGQVKNGKANGRGVALLNTGSRYEGEWRDNERHGQGTFYWTDGQYYVGEYRNDTRHGIGSYYWPNGEKFEGEWANDQRNGQGTFYGKEGEILAKGFWKNDELVEVEKERK